MKSVLIPKKLRRWWIIATLFVFLVNFVIACGGSPTESDVVVEDKERREEDDGK